MAPLKPDQKDALAKAFSDFLEDFAEESATEEEDEDETEEEQKTMPMKKGMTKYREQMRD